jgi:asparagine synthase (glutamine-hydrolysing)
VIPVGGEFLSRFAYYAERSTYLAEGGVDVSNAADLYVSERAREIAPVKIVGTWGSEILRQDITFKPSAPVAGLFQPEFLSQVATAERTYSRARQEHPVTFAAFRQAQWHHYGIFALEHTHLNVRSPFLANDLVRAAYRAPSAGNGSGDVRLRLIKEASPTLARIRSDRGVGGASGRLVSEAARMLQELTFKAEYARDYGMPQWAARLDSAASPLGLDRLFLGRHKFLHFRVWYRDSLSDYVRQVLLDPVSLSRPYLQRHTLENIVRGHVAGNRNYTVAIHKLLTLELLHRLFL